MYTSPCAVLLNSAGVWRGHICSGHKAGCSCYRSAAAVRFPGLGFPGFPAPEFVSTYYMLRRNDKDMSPIRLYIFATIYCFATIKVVLTGSVVVTTRLPTVTTSSGDVFGSLLPRNKDDDLQSEVAQYLGIPFAKPTKRWEPPQDFFAQPYVSDPLNATMWGRACLQVLSETSTYGSEDCLSANVWTPAIDGNEDGNESLLPVLVFIYGGSDQFGEAEPYNMSALAAYHQVVAVNFNYRTGPIGWMSFQEDVEANRSTGNFGILDIQSALRWVQREIVHFGGDKSRVAIHGQSSGGGLVELQYVSPQSNNLFQAAISESGGLHAESLASALDVSREAAKLTGCANASSPKTCMQALPGLNITSLTYQLGWGPVVDGVTIPYDPMEMLEDGAINPSSVVFGAQTNDSFLFLSEDYTKDGLPQPNSYPDGHLRAISKTEYEIALSKSVPSALVSAALTLYPPSADARSIVNVHMLGAVESDDMHCALRRRAAHFDRAQPDKNTSFVYRFDYYYKSSPTCK